MSFGFPMLAKSTFNYPGCSFVSMEKGTSTANDLAAPSDQDLLLIPCHLGKFQMMIADIG